MNYFKLIRFEPLDSMFFREAKPFNAGEGGFLDSQFPPPAQTLSGAIRGAMGDAVGINWQDTAAVLKLVGASGDDPAPLRFQGPYVFKDDVRLFPLPLFLMCKKTDAAEIEWQCLRPSEALFTTDAGLCRLPASDRTLEGSKQIELGWLDFGEMQSVLNGALPKDYIAAEKVFVREARVGIGRDNKLSVVNDSQLYFTRHVRLQPGIGLGMALAGGNAPTGATVRLGGEGRLARMTQHSMPPALPAPTIKSVPKGLILILLTHGDFNGATEPDWSALPAGLQRVCACIGKAVREGGWDYAHRKPKPLKSLVPAGSCYFLTVSDGNFAGAISALHGTHIGARTNFGYGEIAVGLWT